MTAKKPVEPVKRRVKQLLAIMLFGLACSTHFWPLFDPYIPTTRSDKRLPANPYQLTAAEAKVEIEASWDKIESLMDETQKAMLAAPATEEQIADLENMIGQALPEDFKASLRVHNGCKSLLSAPAIMNVYRSRMRLIHFPIPALQANGENFHHASHLVFTFIRGNTFPSIGAYESAVEVCTGSVVRITSRNRVLPGSVVNPAPKLITNNFADYLQDVAESSSQGSIRW